MDINTIVTFIVTAAVIAGLLYIFVFKKGEETKGGYTPSYQKPSEDGKHEQAR